MSIRELREAVEAGTIHISDTDAFISVSDDPHRIIDAHHAYRGSLDAAKRLHDVLLPNAEWFPKMSVHGPHGGILYRDRADDTGVQVNSENPARAWLIAILRALEEEGRGCS